MNREAVSLLTVYDLHTHSTYSDGDTSVEYIMERAAQLGYRAGTSDHLFCDGLFTEQDIRGYLDGVCGRGFPVGGEANIGEDFLLSDQDIARFDYLIASVHAVFPEEGPLRFNRYFAMRYGFRDSWESYDKSRTYEYLTLAYQHIESHFSRYRTDILGHCGVMPFYDDMPYDSKELIDWENGVVSLCKKYNVALEISSMWKEPYERFLRAAYDGGLLFSFGSDCHTKEAVCELSYSLEMAEKLGLDDSRLFIPKY